MIAAGLLRFRCLIAQLAAAALLATGALAADDLKINPPGTLKDNFGQGAVDYSSYAPGIRFPIMTFPSRLNSQVRGQGGGAIGGDQCDPVNYDNLWWDTLCETRSKKDSPPLGCPLKTVHQGVDIRGGTTETCKKLVTSLKNHSPINLVPVIAVKDGTIKQIGSYSVDLWPDSGERFRYLHMNMQGLKVSKGDKVTAGQTIGFMYNDFGGTPTTFHLHFEHWKNINGKGFVPVPVYCDLVGAYERDQGVKSTMIGGGQRCEGSNAGSLIAPPPTSPLGGDVDKVASYWTLNGSEVGLVAEEDIRKFIFTSPVATLLQTVKPGDQIFVGKKDGDRYVGRARVLGDGCGSDEFDVSGPVTEGGLKVEISGTRLKQGAACSAPGNGAVTMHFDFVRKRGEGGTGGVAAICAAPLERMQKTELTRNWGAITMYVPWDNWLAYIKLWPGLKVGADGKPVDVQIDKLGGSIMAFESDEAGVGIWWYWLLVRKGYGKDGVATSNPTLAKLARGIAGDTANEASINNYVNAYSALSEQYFGKRLGADDPIAIGNPDQLWALGQTMFHHESGRTPLIDKATFQRGIQFGTDFMSGSFRGKNAYLLKCGDHPAPSEPQPGDTSDKDQQIAALQETNARLTAMISDLQKRLREIGKLTVE
ncbi:M23 family metallopeptidase [Mesorhizobium sp. B2-4-4]|uniref:M23 family metallopeptidase n=1 Tax=Mesorhizobium sp. B2-4-4 TaxID=2589945 RepID=UPI00112DFBE5|nr:M23 family metallopeptidase [Mesorhizobium sp. B2-4-4]TPL53095.1 M23 family metallopeptidase [Mesorhizobium sp. B2-4-4]